MYSKLNSNSKSLIKQYEISYHSLQSTYFDGHALEKVFSHFNVKLTKEVTGCLNCYVLLSPKQTPSFLYAY